jgi:hypothetical protein
MHEILNNNVEIVAWRVLSWRWINDPFIFKSMHYRYVGVDSDRLCGLVLGVPGYRSRGPGFDSRRYQIF